MELATAKPYTAIISTDRRRSEHIANHNGISEYIHLDPTRPPILEHWEYTGHILIDTEDWTADKSEAYEDLIIAFEAIMDAREIVPTFHPTDYSTLPDEYAIPTVDHVGSTTDNTTINLDIRRINRSRTERDTEITAYINTGAIQTVDVPLDEILAIRELLNRAYTKGHLTP